MKKNIYFINCFTILILSSFSFAQKYDITRLSTDTYYQMHGAPQISDSGTVIWPTRGCTDCIIYLHDVNVLDKREKRLYFGDSEKEKGSRKCVTP